MAEAVRGCQYKLDRWNMESHLERGRVAPVSLAAAKSRPGRDLSFRYSSQVERLARLVRSRLRVWTFEARSTTTQTTRSRRYGPLAAVQFYLAYAQPPSVSEDMYRRESWSYDHAVPAPLDLGRRVLSGGILPWVTQAERPGDGEWGEAHWSFVRDSPDILGKA